MTTTKYRKDAILLGNVALCVYLCRSVTVRASQMGGGHGPVDAADTQNKHIIDAIWQYIFYISSLDVSWFFILWSTKCLDMSPFRLIPLLMTLLTLNEDWDVTADDDLQTTVCVIHDCQCECFRVPSYSFGNCQLCCCQTWEPPWQIFSEHAIIFFD